jgi:uncharacterized membrane protein YoaK (UPF0700 family)
MPQNYGTTSHGSDQNGTAHSRIDTDQESQPLLRQDSKVSSISSRFYGYMKQDIDTKWGDVLLLSCYVITGLLDSSAVFIWGAFVSMQTGNTVYFGLGLADPKSGDRWIKSLISISFFCLGSFLFARFHRYFSPRARWVLVVSFSVQLAMIVAAAVIVTIDNHSDDPLRWEVVIPLAIVAFQSSGQAVTSRALKYNALTSVVLTSIYCDLFSDAELFAGLGKNVERNRRMLAPLCLLLGAVIGGHWSNDSAIGLAGALWTAVGLKLLIVTAWLFWKKASDEEY